MILNGNAIKYGDDINTDLIIPGRYLSFVDPKELAKHAMEGLDPSFLKKIGCGDILVVGKNFGYGSSREQAAMSLKYVGVRAIIAKSFARIFYRNAINQGISIIESPEACDAIDNGDELEINLCKRVIKDKTKNIQFKIPPFPDFIQEIIDAGGLIPMLKRKL